MPTLLNTPGEGLTLGGTGAALPDNSAASAVYVRLYDFWGGWWWDPSHRAATAAERVTGVTPLGVPMIEARARYLLADLVSRGVIADLVVAATANLDSFGYDLDIAYTDLQANRPVTLPHFVPFY